MLSSNEGMLLTWLGCRNADVWVQTLRHSCVQDFEKHLAILSACSNPYCDCDQAC